MMPASILANNMINQGQQQDRMDAAMQKLQGAAGKKMSPEQVKHTAQEFESMFISQMLEHMFSGDSMGESLFGNAETDEIYQGMMIQEYSKAIVKGGGIGIADYIEQGLARRELLKTQEV